MFRLLLVGVVAVVAFNGDVSAQDPILNSARQLREAGEAQAAVGLLESARERSGETPGLLVELGLTYVALGRHADAIPVLERAAAAGSDPHVAAHRTEVDAALAGARAAVGAPARDTSGSGPPAAGGPDPFAADADPNATPMPMPAGASPAETAQAGATPMPGGQSIPPELRETLQGSTPPAAPLTRTDWYAPRRGLRPFGVFGNFTFTHGDHWKTSTADDLRLAGPDYRRTEEPGGEELRPGGRFGVEGNLPLVERFFGTLRFFVGFTQTYTHEHRAARLVMLSGDPNFEALSVQDSSVAFEDGRRTVFGPEALVRWDLNKIVVGLGARFIFSRIAGRMDTDFGRAYYRGDTCDFSGGPEVRSAEYGCSRQPYLTELTTAQAEEYLPVHAWFIDAQALLEASVFLDSQRYVALDLTLGLGKPAVSISLGLSVHLGPSLGADQ